MLNVKSDRALLMKLGWTQEDLSKLRAWTTFDDPKDSLTEEVVRLAMEDYRKTLARKVADDPAAEDDPVVPGLPAPPSLAAETAYVNELVSGRLAARPTALLAWLRTETSASDRTVAITILRVAAVLVVGIAIGGGFGLYLGKRQEPSSATRVERQSSPQYSSQIRSGASAGSPAQALRSTDSLIRYGAVPMEGLLLTKVNEIPISSEPAGATVTLQSTRSVVLGTTPTLLEVYAGPNDVSYVAAKSGDEQLAPDLVEPTQ